tara:strand:- start:546 stop:728 length:183 start_codon:yes stop_codon:yes gene_type:complete
MKTKKKLFNKKLLDVLVCPKTKTKLTYDKKNNRLISKKAGLAYLIKNGIPIMIIEKAKKL